ncbi:MAG: hypothetical protein K5745_07065 [Saccharofermentans sp.]|nr:hypothetical protein [Saccharofermentans sp.]
MSTFVEKAKKKISITSILLWVALGIYAVAQSLVHNPDTDAFFIIDIGRYIFTNHQIPHEAYWYINEGLHTIVQQWLCGVVNYAAYLIGKDIGMVVLGILMNGVFLLALYKYGKDTLKDKTFGLNAAIFCWIAMNKFISTRPYAITISVALMQVLILREFAAKSKPTNKEFLLFILKICLMFLFIANWQSSNILFLALFMLCFIPRINGKKFSVNWRVLVALVLGLLVTPLNPNGLDGPLYLWYSKGYLAPFDIIEVAPPKIVSVYTFLILIVAGLTIYGLVKKKITSDEVFLAFGCIFMSCLFMRCCWTLILPLIPMLRFVKITDRSNDILKLGYIAVGFVCISQIFIFYLGKTNEREEMVTYLPSPDQTVLYTDFNTGSLFLLDGYKVYYDSRPELMGEDIAGEGAFYDEAVSTWDGSADYDSFVAKYGFNYFAPTIGTPMDSYLEANPDRFKLIYTNTRDEINIYQSIL